MSISRFSFPTTIHFGPGASKLAGAHLRDHGLHRPLIVTDQALAALPVLAEFMTHLRTGLDVGVYSGVHGNPTASQVMDGAAAYRTHRADCVIGFSGGAALDVAKVVALMAVHDGHVLEYVWDHPQVRPITHELPYFVALPTGKKFGLDIAAYIRGVQNLNLQFDDLEENLKTVYKLDPVSSTTLQHLQQMRGAVSENERLLQEITVNLKAVDQGGTVWDKLKRGVNNLLVPLRGVKKESK